MLNLGRWGRSTRNHSVGGTGLGRGGRGFAVPGGIGIVLLIILLIVLLR